MAQQEDKEEEEGLLLGPPKRGTIHLQYRMR